MLVNNLNGGHNDKHAYVYVHVAFVWHNKWKPLQSTDIIPSLKIFKPGVCQLKASACLVS